MDKWTSLLSKLSDVISIVGDGIDAIQMVINIFALFIIPYIITKVIRKRRLSKVFGFSRKKVSAFVSVYTEKFVDFDYPVVTYAEMTALARLQKCLADINIALDFQKDIQTSTDFDAVCIGGPSSNTVVNSLLENQFGQKVCFVGQVGSKYFENSKINVNNLQLNSEFWGMQIGKQKFCYIENVQDYAFIAKFTADDFNDRVKRSIIVFWGIEIIGTEKAVAYFVENYSRLYKTFRNKHFLVALRINLADESVDLKTGLIDLTNEVFGK